MPSSTASGQPKPQTRRRPNLELIGQRINAGLSREMLARRVGVGKETIRLAEAGHVPTPQVQGAIAKEFRLKPLDLWPIEYQRRPKTTPPARQGAQR